MSKGHILIVDDDDLNLEVMQSYLELEDYTVSTAYSGERAIEQVGADVSPDLILLDARMSGMDGYETCKALKADPKTQAIPVMMVTGYQADEDIDKAIAAGADDLLFKPVKTKLMMLRVKTLVHMKHLHDQLPR